MGASRATICPRVASQSVGPHFAGLINRESSYYNGTDLYE